mmetsp:Transcript_12164/g.37064  ORF Transcript_12164/g.37064 Transcript_12164/m.37064 type:complete len:317 (+) Transcript_12164:846-1796(+)
MLEISPVKLAGALAEHEGVERDLGGARHNVPRHLLTVPKGGQLCAVHGVLPVDHPLQLDLGCLGLQILFLVCVTKHASLIAGIAGRSVLLLCRTEPLKLPPELVHAVGCGIEKLAVGIRRVADGAGLDLRAKHDSTGEVERHACNCLRFVLAQRFEPHVALHAKRVAHRNVTVVSLHLEREAVVAVEPQVVVLIDPCLLGADGVAQLLDEIPAPPPVTPRLDPVVDFDVRVPSPSVEVVKVAPSILQHVGKYLLHVGLQVPPRHGLAVSKVGSMNGVHIVSVLKPRQLNLPDAAAIVGLLLVVSFESRITFLSVFI